MRTIFVGSETPRYFKHLLPCFFRINFKTFLKSYKAINVTVIRTHTWILPVQRHYWLAFVLMNNVSTDSPRRLRPVISHFRVFSSRTPTSIFVIHFPTSNMVIFSQSLAKIDWSFPLNQKRNDKIGKGRVWIEYYGKKVLVDRSVRRKFFCSFLPCTF